MHRETRIRWTMLPVVAALALTGAGCQSVLKAEFENMRVGGVVDPALPGTPNNDSYSYSPASGTSEPLVVDLRPGADGGAHAEFRHNPGVEQTMSFRSRPFPASSDNESTAAWIGRMESESNSELQVEFKNGNGVTLCAMTLRDGQFLVGGSPLAERYVLGRPYSVDITANRSAGTCSYRVIGSGLNPPLSATSPLGGAWAMNTRLLDFTWASTGGTAVYLLDSVNIYREN